MLSSLMELKTGMCSLQDVSKEDGRIIQMIIKLERVANDYAITDQLNMTCKVRPGRSTNPWDQVQDVP